MHLKITSPGRIKAVLRWFSLALLVVTIHYLSQTTSVLNHLNATTTTGIAQSYDVSNPHFGWQPDIAPTMNCSWRECFQEGHNCTTCRDSVEDLGPPPDDDPSDQWIPDDWVPDVTMLHKMMLAGKDAKGRPWPPVLDQELCEDIGFYDPSTTEDDYAKTRKSPFVVSFSHCRVCLGSYPYPPSLPLVITNIPLKVQMLSPTEKTPKIMCMIYSMEHNHATNIRVMRETWASYCDGFLVFSTVNDPRIPAISVPHEGPEIYKNMWQKVRSMMNFVGTHYLKDFDFFYQGGEDMYAIPQNLKLYLKQLLDEGNKTSDDDFFIGQRFEWPGWSGVFNVGGPGYVLSRGLLRKYLEEGYEHPDCAPDAQVSHEDIMMGKCLRAVFGVEPMDSRDSDLRQRFHHANIEWYIRRNIHTLSRLFYDQPTQEGARCCSPNTVAFHYVKNPAMVRHIHSLIYHC